MLELAEKAIEASHERKLHSPPMRIQPFRGVRYAGVSDAGTLAAPPYDQIDDRLRDRFHQTLHHFVRLSRPVAGDGHDAPRHAAALHDAWLAHGILREEPQPSLYVNEIVLPGGDRRLGLTALLGIEPPESPVIRPHEETLAKAVADRLELLRAMRVDLEPILLLADDGGALDELLTADCDADALVEHRDATGNTHRLFQITDEARIARYRAALADAPGLIADGHHRYKVASLYAAERGARPDSPAACKLAVITSLASPALTIDPIHRALTDTLPLEPLLPLVARRQPLDEATGAAAAAAVAAAPQPAIAVWPRGGAPEIWSLDAEHPELELSPERRRLAVAMLHFELLPRLGLAPEAATDGTVSYRSDPEALERDLAGGEFSLGILLPPMDPAAFAAALGEGGLLPPKSTRFLPKVVSGLVWARH